MRDSVVNRICQVELRLFESIKVPQPASPGGRSFRVPAKEPIQAVYIGQQLVVSPDDLIKRLLDLGL